MLKCGKPATTMAQNNEGRIIKSWSLIAFAQEKGADIAVGTCQGQDGSTFQAVSFTQGDQRTFVDFGESLQPGLSFEEIVANVNDLQVVQLATLPEVLARRQAKAAQTGKPVQLETYKLCKKGESSWKGGNLFVALGV